jgi:hypothetical protein
VVPQNTVFRTCQRAPVGLAPVRLVPKCFGNLVSVEVLVMERQPRRAALIAAMSPAIVPVPKAAMNENYLMASRKNNIRLAGQIASVNPKSIAPRVQPRKPSPAPRTIGQPQNAAHASPCKPGWGPKRGPDQGKGGKALAINRPDRRGRRTHGTVTPYNGFRVLRFSCRRVSHVAKRALWFLFSSDNPSS